MIVLLTIKISIGGDYDMSNIYNAQKEYIHDKCE